MFILEQIENFLLRDEILNTLDENSRIEFKTRIENSEMQKYSHICISKFLKSRDIKIFRFYKYRLKRIVFFDLVKKSLDLGIPHWKISRFSRFAPV